MTMPDKPSRSVFVPFLIVGMLAALAFVVLFVPLRTCDYCQGIGQMMRSMSYEPWLSESGDFTCSPCSGSGKVPLLNIWRREAKETP